MCNGIDILYLGKDMYQIYIDNNFELLEFIYLLIFITIFSLSIVLIRVKVRKLKEINRNFRLNNDALFKITLLIFFWPVTIVIILIRAVIIFFLKIQDWLIAWVNDEQKSNEHGN